MEPTERINITPGQLAASLCLRNNSALESCTEVDGDGDGNLFITRNWPQLSTGEELLWSLLGWLNGADSLPDLTVLRSHLDAGNYAAAITAVEVGIGTGVTA